MHSAIKVFCAAVLIITLSTLFVSSILYLPPRQLERLRKADALRPTLKIPTVVRDAMPHPDVHPLVGPPQSDISSLPVDASRLTHPPASDEKPSHPITVKLNEKRVTLGPAPASKLNPPSRESRAIARAIADAMLRLTEQHAPLESYSSEDDEDDEDDGEDDENESSEVHHRIDNSATSERNSPYIVQTAVDDPALQSTITKLAKSARDSDRAHIQHVIHSSDSSAKIEEHPRKIVGSSDDVDDKGIDSEDHDDDQDHNDPDGSAMRRAMEHLVEQHRMALATEKRDTQIASNVRIPTTNNERIKPARLSDNPAPGEHDKKLIIKGVSDKPVEGHLDGKLESKNHKAVKVQNKAVVVKNEKLRNGKGDDKVLDKGKYADTRPVTMEDAMAKLVDKLRDRPSQILRNNDISDAPKKKLIDETEGNRDDKNVKGDHIREVSTRQNPSLDRGIRVNLKVGDKDSPVDAMAKAMGHLASEYRNNVRKAQASK